MRMRMRKAYIRARATHFVGALPPKEKCVEQVEKSFLLNEGGCRDVTS